MVLGALAVAALLLVVLWGSRTSRPTKATATAKSGAHVARFTTRAMPVPDGSLRITGVVRDASGPLAGVHVSASRVEPEETLSERSCPPSEDRTEAPGGPPARLIKGCWTQAYTELLEAVSAREGEARILAETTTDTDGTFVLDGLPEGVVTLWALGQEGAAMRPDVMAGSRDVVLGLEEGSVFEGIVTDADPKDAPIAGARVTVFSHQHTRFFDAVTDARGRFRIGPLPLADYALLITADDRMPRLSQVARSLESEVFVLERLARYAGRVVSAQGTPAPGVQVVLYAPLLEPDVRVTTTDAQGRFSLMAAGSRENELFAEAAARGAFASAKSAPREDLVLTLEPGGFLEGTVRDDAGKSLAGARIRAIRMGHQGFAEHGQALTDANGHYRLGPVPPWSVFIEASAAQCLDEDTSLHPFHPDTGPLDFTLTRAFSVEGLVVDDEGQPLAGMEVQLQEGSPSDRVRNAHRTRTGRADAAGRFVVETGYTGPGWLEVFHPSFLDAKLAVDIPSREVRMVLHRGASVSVTVLGAAGAPLHGITVTLWKREERGFAECTGVTDEQGRVTLRGVRPGGYVVEALLRTRALDQHASRPVDVTEQEAQEVSLRLEEGRTLRGRVVNTRGQPLAGVAVRAAVPPGDAPRYRDREPDPDVDRYDSYDEERPEGVLTDEEGRFTLRHLSAPRYVLTASLAGHRFDAARSQGGTPEGTESLTVGSNASEVRLVMRRRQHARGRVVAEGGAALESFQVNDQPPRTPDGTFELWVEETGDWRLLVEAEGFAPLERTLTVDGETDLDLGTLTLKRGRTVRVLLRDAVTGVPYNGRLSTDKGVTITVAVHYRIRAEGSLNGPPYPGQHRGVPTLDGTLLLEHLPATAFALELEAPLYLPLHTTVGAEEETLTARLEPGARVTGHVRDAQGRPAPAALVFMSADGTWVDHQTDDTGAFDVRALPPGLYTVMASASDSISDLRFQPQSVRIPSSGEVHLTFEALGSGTTVTLRMTEDVHTALLLPGQVPAPGSSKAFDVLTSRQHPQVEWTGLSMRFSRVPAGHYTLLAVNRAREGVHREELDVPTEGTLSRDVRPVWTPLAR
ncbi:carboxypeptidase regulatory-like domain-containing protein [Corallococcus sp. CA053C]|nr:carboxypeptidase regulatory-like domain-containing protein [Corallococcus sp. CA053C]